MNEQSAENALPPERYDDPWDFAVTWDVERGPLYTPILRLFRHSPSIIPGEAIKRTDKGHATYYVRAVQEYVQKCHPDRVDIAATATRVIPPALGHKGAGA